MLYKLSGVIAIGLLLTTSLFAQKNDAFQTAMYMEKWQKAVSIQEERCKATPDDWINWMYMADAYSAAMRPVDVRTALEKAAKNTTQPAYQSIIAGRVALLDGQNEAAEKLFTKAAKAGRKDIVALRLLGESRLYGPSRDLHLAEARLLDAQKRNNRDYQTHMDLGYCYRALLDGGKALTQFDFAQAISPKNPLPALMTAMVYKSGKVEARQLEYLNKALALDSQSVIVLRQKAEFFYYQKRDYKQAVAAYAHLLDVKPKVPIEDKMAYVNALFLTKQYASTILWVDKIIGEDGSRNYLRRLSAYSYYETEKFEQGKIIMDEYFARVDSAKIIPQDYEYYAKFLQKENQDSLAAGYYQKAIELDPARWDLYAEIGAIRYKTKDYLGAAEAYELRLDSLSSPAPLDYYKIGIARYMLPDSLNHVLAAGYFAKVCEAVPSKSIGWLMQAKSLAKLEPDLETYPERTGAFGIARDAFEHFVEIAEKEDLTKQKKDLITAYEYLAYYHIVQKDAEKVQVYLSKLESLDPANDSVKAISEWVKTASMDE